MSNFDRLQRVVKSWTGIFRGEPRIYLGFEEARTVLTYLGHQMTPETFATLTSSTKLLDDFLGQFHAAEAELGKPLVNESLEMLPEWDTKVEQEGDRLTFTIQVKGIREILAVLNLKNA